MKAGEAYLRGLLVNDARAVIANLGEKQDRFSRWVRTLIERRGYWRACRRDCSKECEIGVGLAAWMQVAWPAEAVWPVAYGLYADEPLVQKRRTGARIYRIEAGA